MPYRKKIIHYCAKCKKEMLYEEKKMLYTYDVVRSKIYGLEKVASKKRYAINLCDKCVEDVETLVKEFVGNQ